MGRIRIALLLLIASVLLHSNIETVQAIDFSQFYLPPCCYIAPQGEPYSGYASASVVNTKQEPAPAFREAEEEIRNVSLSTSTNKTKTFPPDSIRLYKLIIPIENEVEFEIETTTGNPSREDSTQLQPPSVTVENILFPDMENITDSMKFKRGSNNKLESSRGKNVSSNVKTVIFHDELPEKSSSEKKSLADLESKRITKSSFTNESSLTLTTTESSWKNVKLVKPVTEIEKRNEDKAELLEDPLQVASSEIQQSYTMNGGVRKMPAVWLQNLRRALFQSLTAEKREASDQIEVQGDSKQRNSFPKQFWKRLRKAKLKYVDKLSQSSSDLPEAIYLPTGQGPIVSGVVVNSPSGLELRLASELYTAHAGGGEARDNCQCSLIHHGDIVMAYWSVSRIFNEHGNPALQYLVYPLPFTVPTPPGLLPFPGGGEFRPSPIDPIANYQEVHHHHSNYLGDLTNKQIPSPPFFHQLANGHHRLEITQNPGPASELHTQIPILPSNPTGQYQSTINPLPHSPGPVHIKDYRKVLVENEHGYTPEFLEMYRAAILEHFRQKDAYNNNNRVPYHGQTGPSGPTGVSPLIPHHSHQHQPTDLPHHAYDPPVQENPIIAPTGPPPPPLSSPGQLSGHSPHSNYPNSIQDILAPILPSGPGPSALPPLDNYNFIHPHPYPTGQAGINNLPPQGQGQGQYPAGPAQGTRGGNYPPNNIYPENYPKVLGNKDNNRPNTGQKTPNVIPKNPNNKDKYPYPSKYPPVGLGDPGVQNYPFPPGQYPPGVAGAEFRPPIQANFNSNLNDVEGNLPYRPSSDRPERPIRPYYDKDRYDNNKLHEDDTNNQKPILKGVGTAYTVKDKLYYPDSSPKPYVKYNVKKPQETSKLTQVINETSYILNF